MATPPREGSEEAAPAPAPPVASVSPRVEGPEEAEDAEAVMAEKAAAISQASPPRRVPPRPPPSPAETTSCKQGAGGGPAGRKRPGWRPTPTWWRCSCPPSSSSSSSSLLRPEEAAPRAPLLPAPFLEPRHLSTFRAHGGRGGPVRARKGPARTLPGAPSGDSPTPGRGRGRGGVPQELEELEGGKEHLPLPAAPCWWRAKRPGWRPTPMWWRCSCPPSSSSSLLRPGWWRSRLVHPRSEAAAGRRGGGELITSGGVTSKGDAFALSVCRGPRPPDD